MPSKPLLLLAIEQPLGMSLSRCLAAIYDAAWVETRQLQLFLEANRIGLSSSHNSSHPFSAQIPCSATFRLLSLDSLVHNTEIVNCLLMPSFCNLADDGTF